MLCAAIDLGTNTFHLLIAESPDNDGWTMVHRSKAYVRLAEEGIRRIGPAAFQRGLATLEHFAAILNEHGVPPENVRAYGTAALRTAANGPDFIEEVYRRSGLRVEAISGDREAALICQGVRRAVPFPVGERALIMDIGGGSVEFILADREQVFWARSFPIGVAVLRHQYPHSDPILAEEIAAVEHFLDEALSDLWEVLEQQPTAVLIGASGTFDVIDLFLLDPDTKHPLYGYIPAAAFEPLYQQLVSSTLAERRQMEKMPPERVEMIVVAVILVRLVLRRAGIRDLYTSTYAMKEGILDTLFSK